MPKPTAFSRGNSTIFVCSPKDTLLFSLTVVYHDVNASQSLARRLNLDLSQPFVKITDLNKGKNYSIQLEQTGSCSENQKTEAVYVVTGRKGKGLFLTFQFNYFVTKIVAQTM